MFCKRGVYVNWGNIPHLEFDFGPVNLFSGGNGSGKTTAADGLQSLMTAAHENLFNYNPGQDETTQKGRGGKQVRTLASYILGCDDGSYARTRPTDGYVAGIFHPTQGENAEKFTAIMGVRARIDTASSPRQARQDSLLFLIIPGHEVTLEDLVVEDVGGKYVVPLTELAKRLKAKWGSDSVEAYDKKGPYLRRLYGALRGLNTAVSDREAKHAARTFSNFMAYKPVKSITEFVAREVLEPKDLSEDIRQVSELMKTIHSMDEETRHIKESLANLEGAKNLASQTVEDWIQYSVNQYCETSRKLIEKQQDYLKQKNEQRLNHEAIKDNDSLAKSNASKKQQIHAQLVELQAKRQGIAALKDKDQLEQDIQRYQDQLVQQVAPLLQQEQQFTKNFDAAKSLQQKLAQTSLAVDVPALDSKGFSKPLKDVLDAGSETGLNTQELLTKDWVGISSLETKLAYVKALENVHTNLASMLYDQTRSLTSDGEAMSIRDQVFAALNKHKEQLQRAGQQHQSKQQEIQQLQNKKVRYPAHVEAAVAAIASQCPQAKPAVLCDFIEVIDPNWQMAIEGYIGGARFSVIVEPKYEAEAIRIVRSIKGNRNNTRVIQGAKVQRDAARVTPPRDSIFDVMEFSHRIVEYYIKASYGSVVRVDDEETLRQTSRGLMANGLGSGNYSMFRCDIDDAQLVFGQGARDRALLAQQNQLQNLLSQHQQLQASYQCINDIYALISDIQPVSCSQAIDDMLALYRKLDHAEMQLNNLDLSDFEELEAQLQALHDDYNEIESSGRELSEALGALNSRVLQFDRAIGKLASEQEQLQEQQETQETFVKEITSLYAEFNSEKALEEADNTARLAKSDFNFEQDNLELMARMERAERQLYDAVTKHNQVSNTYNSIVYFSSQADKSDTEFFSNVIKIGEQIGAIYNTLKNNVLVDKHEKLGSLKESFNTAFVTNLCHSIFQSINHGKQILDDLNRELEHHRFGADRERFYFAYDWVPEFREYQRFFKEVIEIPNLGDGSSLFDVELSDKSREVRDKLMGMLLDKDEQVAQRELQRISDYRHYRRYEIFKEPLNKEPIALSTYGTGSGGQLETPAYIIRSAAVTSAFRFNEGNAHCRMVLVDEAFSKMDETRSREVIHYLTETLGLQLIFIMPTSKSGPFMDLISNQVVFSKCPTAEKIGELNTRVLVDRKTCNQEKIKDLWANHRKTIRQQAMLDFMDEIVAEE